MLKVSECFSIQFKFVSLLAVNNKNTIPGVVMRHLNLFLSTVLALLVDNIKWRVVVKTAALLIELSTPADYSNKYPNKHQLTAWHLPLTSTHLALNVAIGNRFDCISIEENNKLLLLFRLDKSIEWLINQGPTVVKHNSFIICF